MRAPRPTRALRDLLVGERGQFVFEPGHSARLPDIASADVYIHIPFCRSLCPYCPYNRVLYEPAAADAYISALHCEIDSYAETLGDIGIGSVYVGGGTPTTVIDELGSLVRHLRKRFRHDGLVAVETTPEDLDTVNTAKLRAIGIDLLSIGVQSFDDRYLKFLGRRHRSDILAEVIDRALAAGFDSVNVDLMFALPGQTTEEALSDLDAAISLGAEQVTLYPLFTFPYSAVGKHLRLTNVDFPKLGARRRMYRAIHEHARASGFEPVSVWGFRKGATTRFSSVTRDDYVGLGAGAASCLPGTFYFNSFSIPAYTERCASHASPVSLQMDMSAAMTNLYWLYWRLYETCVPKTGFERRFADDKKLRLLLRLAMHLRLVADDGDEYVLTESGAFWIHLMQNYYVLNYIDKVWTRSMCEAWPGRIEL